MNIGRRELLAGGGSVAAFLPLGADATAHAKVGPHPDAVRKPDGRRVSVIKGDPGERLYAELCGDNKVAHVFLNGVEQKHCMTADEREGLVVRTVITPNGNVAINWANEEILYETVFGDVRLEIVDKNW